MKSLFERLRSRRLASVFVLLATLSVAIVPGLRGTRRPWAREANQQRRRHTSQGRQFSGSSNEFVKIARLVGPLWSTSTPRPSPSRPKTRVAAIPTPYTPIPQNPDDEDQPDEPQQGQGGGQGGGQGNFQDFFNRFFGGQMPDQDGDDGQVRESLGSGFIVDPRATSSPTITSSRRPTRSTSSSPPTPTRRTSAARACHRL